MRECTYTFRFHDDGRLDIEFSSDKDTKILSVELIGALEMAKQDLVADWLGKSEIEKEARTNESPI